MAEGPDKIFDAYYYQTGCGRPYQRDEAWMRFFNEIAERIIRETAPKTVLDAGCALGFLVEALRTQGVEAYGVDISEYAISSAHSSIQPYVWVGSIADPFPQSYDLIVTIEVLEHMPKDEAEKAVANLCRHTDDIIFSSGNEDLREITHINLHPAEYWAGLFAQQGFYRDVDFDGTFLTAWTVRFRRQNEPAHRIIMGYERQIDRLIQENAAVRQVNLEQRQALSRKEQETQGLRSQIDGLNTQISAITGSRTYRAAHFLRALVPLGSRRERWGLKLWRLISRGRR
jgi:SAM-dependent methyltransferase